MYPMQYLFSTSSLRVVILILLNIFFQIKCEVINESFSRICVIKSGVHFSKSNDIVANYI